MLVLHGIAWYWENTNETVLVEIQDGHQDTRDDQMAYNNNGKRQLNGDDFFPSGFEKQNIEIPLVGVIEIHLVQVSCNKKSLHMFSSM